MKCHVGAKGSTEQRDVQTKIQFQKVSVDILPLLLHFVKGIISGHIVLKHITGGKICPKPQEKQLHMTARPLTPGQRDQMSQADQKTNLLHQVGQVASHSLFLLGKFLN